MARITAARLRLRAPEGCAARAQARTEDALRIAAPDDDRLLVLRRLDLGHMPVNMHPAGWSERVGRRMAALSSRAVHAAAPGAFAAEAVWFRSEAEARLLLLAELAAGRSPSAWFWTLAVPDWRGAPIAAYLPRLIAAAERDPERLVELAYVVVKIAEAGHLRALLAALPDSSSAVRRYPMPSASSSGGAASSDTIGEAEHIVLPPALLLFDRLPATARRALIETWRRSPPDSPAMAFLARMAVLVAMPELAARPALAAMQAHKMVQALLQPGVDAAPPPSADPLEVRPAAAGDLAATSDGHPKAGKIATEPEPMIRRPEEDRAIDVAAAPTIEATEASPFPIEDGGTFRAEQGSAAAGLWLLVRPLAHMGLAAWLDARPDLLVNGFGRALLRSIARRLRVADDDPLFAQLGEEMIAHDPDLLAAWRIGLDRWLRRRVRRRLSEVVMRRGWLSPEETRIGIRFRVEQADIALRARALDVDPGWVPWLGLSIVYLYRDEALR